MNTTPLSRRSAAGISIAAALLFSACGGSDEPAAEPVATDALIATTVTTDAPIIPDVPASTDAPVVTDAPVATEAEPPVSDAPVATEPATTEAPVDDEPVSGYLGSYELIDEEFGTMVTVTVDGDIRTIQANALPDHETGEFPNDGNPNTISAQDAGYEYPATGTFVGNATTAMTPGVAVNGVKFEPATAETVTCESGETLRVEALQDIYNLGLDFNNAHVQPTGEYHYHGISELLADAYATDDDLVHVGFAADGFLMYYSKSSAYSPGYALSTDPRVGSDCIGSGALQNVAVDIDGTTPDGTYASDWIYSADNGDLDECNGTEIDGQYAYLITNEYPFVGRCLNGEFAATGPGAGGPPPGDDQAQGAQGAAPGGAPDLSEAATSLGITQAQLQDALGGPPPDLEAAAATLGVTVDELAALLPGPGQ